MRYKGVVYEDKWRTIWPCRRVISSPHLTFMLFVVFMSTSHAHTHLWLCRGIGTYLIFAFPKIVSEIYQLCTWLRVSSTSSMGKCTRVPFKLEMCNYWYAFDQSNIWVDVLRSKHKGLYSKLMWALLLSNTIDLFTICLTCLL